MMLLDVAPALSSEDLADGCLVDAKLGTERLLGDSAKEIAASDLQYLLVRDQGSSTGFSSAVAPSPLPFPVPGVDPGIPQEEMFWVLAGRDVAVVQHMTLSDGADELLISPSVSEDHGAAAAEEAITIPIHRGGPEQAPVLIQSNLGEVPILAAMTRPSRHGSDDTGVMS